MAHGLMKNELAQTGADRRTGSRPHFERAPVEGQKSQFSAVCEVAPVISTTGAQLAQTGAEWRSAEALRQCASYPPKGGLTGRSLAHATGSELDWRKDDQIHDLPIGHHGALTALWLDALSVDDHTLTIEQARERFKAGAYRGVPKQLVGVIMGGRG